MTKPKSSFLTSDQSVLAEHLPVGAHIKLEDGFSPSYAVVTLHVEDRWGHHCKVQIVSSPHEGRQGALESIQGSSTPKGIGWKPVNFIRVNGDARELVEISPDGTRYSLLGGAWVQWREGAWFLESEEHRFGVVRVEL